MCHPGNKAVLALSASLCYTRSRKVKEVRQMRKTWWKVPLYCIVASWVSFQLETILGRWTLVTLPDGSLTTDFTRWRIVEAVLLAAIVCVGGFLFFRRMTRKEIFFSASVLVVFNVAAGFITSQMQPVASVYFGWMTGWSGVVSSLLFSLTQKPWLASIVQWVLPPYIFGLFGRKDEKEHEEK